MSTPLNAEIGRPLRIIEVEPLVMPEQEPERVPEPQRKTEPDREKVPA